VALSGPRSSTKREYLRFIYEEALDASRWDLSQGGLTAGSVAARHQVISTERKTALQAVSRGSWLQGASANQKSTSFGQLEGISPLEALELADWARGHVDEPLLEDALAESTTTGHGVSEYRSVVHSLRW
jgi:hypothetical protein